jgi:hypothetical protein
MGGGSVTQSQTPCRGGVTTSLWSRRRGEDEEEVMGWGQKNEREEIMARWWSKDGSREGRVKITALSSRGRGWSGGRRLWRRWR